MNRFKHKYGFALLINTLIMAFFLIFYFCTYEVEDDWAMKLISAGSYGQPDSHMVFINSVYGYLISGLYRIIPNIPWYDIIQYLIILLSLTVICYVAVNENDSDVSVLLLIFTTFIAAYFCYVKLQFTKTATISTIAGHFLLYHQIKNNYSYFYYIFPLALLVTGSLIRLEQFLACSLICVYIYIYILVRSETTSDKKINLYKIKRLIITGFICLLVVGVNLYIDKSNYNTSEYSEYLEFNAIRAKLLDRNEISYEKYREIFDKYNINENDYSLLFFGWNYDDCDLATTDVFTKIENEISTVENNVDKPDIISDAYYFFFIDSKTKYYTFLAIISVVLFYISNRKIEDIITVTLSLITCVAVMIFLYYFRGNNFMYRIDISYLLVLIYICILKTKIKLNKCLFLILPIICICFCLNSKKYLRIYEEKDIEYANQKYILSQINEDYDHLYIHLVSDRIAYVKQLFVDINKIYSPYKNLISFGGWTVKHPLNEELKNRYGIKNTYKDLINNDKAYILVHNDDDLLSVMTYINDNYDANAQCILVKDFNTDNYKAYKVISNQ